MSEFKVHNISLGLPGVENKAIAPKKDVKKKIVNNPKSLKFALAGLSVLGMAAAAGIMIYRGKLNTEDLNNLASKTKDKVAQQAGQTVQSFQKSESPQVVSSEKLQEIVSDGATTAVLKQTEEAVELLSKPADEFNDLLAKKDSLTPTRFKKLAELIQGKTEGQKTELARILAEKTESETIRRTRVLNGKISNWNGENDRHIKTIMSYSDEQFEIVEALLKSKTKGLGRYYGGKPELLIGHLYDYNAEGLASINDNGRLQKIFQIVSKDKGIMLADVIEISKCEDSMFERASALTDRGLFGLVAHGNERAAIESLNDEQFKRILEFSDKGCVVLPFDMLECAKLDDKAYKRALMLCEKYGVTSGASDIAKLSDEEFQKVLEKMQAGVPNWRVRDIGDEEFKNFQYLLNKGTDKDKVLASVNLSDRAACEEFLKQYKTAPAGVNIEDLENPEIKARIIDEINSQFGYEVLKSDCAIEDIARLWKIKYVEGGWLDGGYSPSCIDAFLERSLPRFEAEDGGQLGRWMCRDDMYKYIQDFPEIGETYAPLRIQSFAKTLGGAEVHRGNNFSDLNVAKNIKMVVTPKSKLTQAFDIGEGKYGSDEVIYGATQKFEVLKKGFEIVTNPDGRRHRQYVIYLKEL